MYLNALFTCFVVVSIIALVSGRVDKYEWLKQRSLSSFTKEQLKFQQQMLNAHNTYRGRHCVPPLELNNKLSVSAQNYAEYLAQVHRMEHSDNEDLGENIYKRRSTASLRDLTGL